MAINSKSAAAAAVAGGALFCLSPWSSAAIALLLGVFIAISVGNPFVDRTKGWAQKLLSLSIIGLGAGMNLVTVAQAGLSGLAVTALTIAATLLGGIMAGRLLNADGETSVLISVGTAICGGSAIAAIAPVIKAKPNSTTIAFGTVFLLNALALFTFPAIGHEVGLSQKQFGLWSALAIHDTSSVVGAGLQYGSEALQIGTTVKLARALWIVPLTFLFGYFYKKTPGEGAIGKTRKPWFILGFLAMAALVTWVPPLQPMGHYVELAARKCLVVTLFLIGLNLTPSTLKAVGVRPLILGVTLWIIIASSTLVCIKFFTSP